MFCGIAFNVTNISMHGKVSWLNFCIGSCSINSMPFLPCHLYTLSLAHQASVILSSSGPTSRFCSSSDRYLCCISAIRGCQVCISIPAGTTLSATTATQGQECETEKCTSPRGKKGLPNSSICTWPKSSPGTRDCSRYRPARCSVRLFMLLISDRRPVNSSKNNKSSVTLQMAASA